jgi:hypothetical protein
MNQQYIIAGVAVASLTIGAASGYFFAKKKFETSYTEELREAREYYKRVYKAEDFATPEDAAETLLVEATTALKSYQGVEIKDEALEDVQGDEDETEEEVRERNIFDEGDQLTIDPSDRVPGQPYAVTIDEYMENPDNHDQITLTYYAGDNVLASDDDVEIKNVNSVVGRMNLNLFGASDPDQPNVVLVRNDKLNADYEITHSDGKFSHEVLGLQHSDEPQRRVKRRWDDD